MEKFIEKMGLYDIWMTLFPGSIFLVLVKTTINFFDVLSSNFVKGNNVIERILTFLRTPVYIPSTVNELVIFFLLAYCFGLILHEISSGVRKCLTYRNGEPLDVLFETPNMLFSAEQHKELMPSLLRASGQTTISTRIAKRHTQSRACFHKINAYMQRQREAERYVKLNLLYNECSVLALVMALVFFMASALTIGLWIETQKQVLLPAVAYVVVLGVACVILTNKSHKYFKYWVKNMVIAYCLSDDNLSGETHEKD